MTGNPWIPSYLDQNINPWWYLFNPSGQVGLVNLSMKSSNLQVEQEIVEQVASYGRQLGQLTDTISVLLRHWPLSGLPSPEQQTLAEFTSMVQQIASVKAAHATPDETAITRMIDGIELLKKYDPVAFQRVRKRLQILFTPPVTGETSI